MPQSVIRSFSRKKAQDPQKRNHENVFLHLLRLFAAILLFSLFLLSCESQTQRSDQTDAVSISPLKVTQIDEQGLKDLLKPKGRPLLINFWATWCGPCREEFPDLVKIGTDHKDKIDLVTVTLDEPSEINGEVPKFLAEMKSGFPAYLLKTADQDAAINLVSKDWQGALPFTILFNAQGETIYSKQGKFKVDVLVGEIEELY